MGKDVEKAFFTIGTEIKNRVQKSDDTDQKKNNQSKKLSQGQNL